MAGTIAIIIILLLAPVGILMSSTVFVGLLTSWLNNDVDKTHEGSELLEISENGLRREL